MSKLKFRSAFTLVELLVVIVTIAVLISISLPVLNSVREMGRRAACSNKMRQIGVALEDYHSANGEFPSDVPGFSFLSQITPQLDETAIYSSFDFSLSTTDEQNMEVANRIATRFLCPSDGQGGFEANSNYVGNFGFAYQIYGENGIFGHDATVTASDVTDGLSNTSMVSECLVGEWDSADKRRLIFDTPRLQEPQEFEEFVKACRKVISTGVIGDSSRGTLWHNNSFNITHFNHILGPNEGSCTNGTNVSTGAYSPLSNHTGGVNLLFADGHLKFITDAIDETVWRQIGSRDSH